LLIIGSFQHLHCLLDGFIALVDDGIEGLVVVQVSPNQSFYPKFQFIFRISRELRYRFLGEFGVIDQHLVQFLVGNGRFGYEHSRIGILFFKIRLVLIGIVERKLGDCGSVGHRVVAIQIIALMDGHKVVGHDAASAIHGAPAHSLVRNGLVLFDAVDVLHLAVCQSVINFFVVCFGAVFVVALDATSTGRVVARSGQPDGRFVGQIELPLHQSLAKRAAPYDEATVVVLHGPSYNLRCRCAEVVDENDDLACLKAALRVA